MRNRCASFYFQFTDRTQLKCLVSADGLKCPRRLGALVLEWLTESVWLFGLPGQNWMLVAGGGLTIYISVLVYAQRHMTPLH